MKPLLSLLFGTWLLIGGTPPVWACCNSALSCVAAVASAGATCVVDAALSALQIAKGHLEKDRASRQLEFDEALRQMNDETTATVANLKTDLQRVTTLPPPVNLTAIQSNMRSSFDQAFRGKTPAQIGTTRDRLLQEARAKYGADRNLLAAMEQTIVREARVRGGT